MNLPSIETLTSLPYKIGAAAIAIALLCLACYLVGERSAHPVAREVVAAAPAQSLPGGAVLAERVPIPEASTPAPAPHAIPRGMTETRRMQVTVRPEARMRLPSAPGVAPVCECKPVTVDMSLLRDGQGGQRVEASAQGGQIVSALDTPIERALITAEPKRWAAGLSYGTEKSPGVWVTRDLSRLRVGAEVTRNTDGSLMGRAMLGVSW